jgi:hypothetical protein
MTTASLTEAELMPPRQVSAPAELSVVLPCPDCHVATAVDARLFVRRTRDSDGTITLALRTRAPKVAHSCDQIELGLATGSLVR